MLEWSEKFLVGHERIDFEHRIFYGLISDFQEARLRSASAKEQEDILEEIVLYARFHFRSEENLMSRLHYPEIAAHRDMHWRLIDMLHSKILAFRVGSIQAVEIENFLLEWFATHTAQEDTKIINYQSAAETSG